MSNAMRSGKRWLAGVAAGALGAGVLVGLSATPASATVASASIGQTGITIVKPAAGGAVTRFQVDIFLEDANGDAINLDANETLTTQILTSAGAATVETTGPGLSLNSLTATNATTNANFAAGTAGNVVAGHYRVWINPDWPANIETWDDAQLAPGAYTFRATIANSLAGTTRLVNMPIIIQPDTAVPAGSISWTDATGLPTVNSASAQVQGNASLYPAAFRLNDASGFSMVRTAGAFTASLASTTNTGGVANLTATASDGFAVVGGANSASALPAGVYTHTPNANPFLAGNNAYNITYAAAGGNVTSSLPLTVAPVTTVSTTALTLETEPQNAAGNAVPSGTTSLTFEVTPNVALDGSFAWRAVSDAAGGQVTPSAGIAAVGANGRALITVNVNAAAAADGQTVTLLTGNAGGTVAAGTSGAITFQDVVPALTLAANQVAKIGTETTVTGALTDQFGRPVSGAAVVSIATVAAPNNALASANPTAQGLFTLTLTSDEVPATAQTVNYQVRATAAGVPAVNSPFALAIQYTATGDVTSLNIVSNPLAAASQMPATAVPGLGQANTAVSNVVVDRTNTPTVAPFVGGGQVVTMTFTSSPATSITVTGSDGVRFINDAAGDVNWNAGLTTRVVASGTPLRVWSTKTGINTVTATAGGKTATQQFFAYTLPAFARNIALTPETKTVEVGQIEPIIATITDVFGNGIRGVDLSVAANYATDDIGLGGVLQQGFGTTDGEGKSTGRFTGVNGGFVDQVTLRATGAAGAFNAVITGAEPAKRSATSTITVVPSTAKDLTINAFRESGAVTVEGDALGFNRGDAIKVDIKRWNAKKERWSSWRELTTTNVRADGTYKTTFSNNGRFKVRTQAEGVKSNVITVSAAARA